MPALPVLVAVAIWTAGTIWYIRQILGGQFKPTLPAWIIMSTTTILGLVSFFLAPNPTFESGIGFIAGAASSLSVFSVILYQVLHEKHAIQFNRFQKACLIIATQIVVVWIGLKFLVNGELASFVANVLTQVLMTIGYISLAERLWYAEKRVESLFFWTTIFLGGLCSLVVPIQEENALGIIYGLRASVTSLITVGLLLRIEGRKSRTNRSASP